MNKLTIILGFLLIFSLGLASASDRQWDVRFSSRSDGFYAFNGEEFTADMVRVSGYLQQHSPDIEDVRGRVSIGVYDDRRTKMRIRFKPTDVGFRGPDPDGTYYIFGEADISYYTKKEYTSRSGRTYTRRFIERFRDVRMQLRFNPYTNTFRLDKVPGLSIYVHTSIDRMRFNNYRGFDCGYEYADSFDGVYGDDEWLCVNGYVYEYDESRKLQRYRGGQDRGQIGEEIYTTDEGYEVTLYDGSSGRDYVYVWYKVEEDPYTGKLWHFYHKYERSSDIIDLSEVTHSI